MQGRPPVLMVEIDQNSRKVTVFHDRGKQDQGLALLLRALPGLHALERSVRGGEGRDRGGRDEQEPPDGSADGPGVCAHASGGRPPARRPGEPRR